MKTSGESVAENDDVGSIAVAFEYLQRDIRNRRLIWRSVCFFQPPVQTFNVHRDMIALTRTPIAAWSPTNQLEWKADTLNLIRLAGFDWWFKSCVWINIRFQFKTESRAPDHLEELTNKWTNYFPNLIEESEFEWRNWRFKSKTVSLDK